MSHNRITRGSTFSSSTISSHLQLSLWRHARLLPIVSSFIFLWLWMMGIVARPLGRVFVWRIKWKGVRSGGADLLAFDDGGITEHTNTVALWIWFNSIFMRVEVYQNCKSEKLGGRVLLTLWNVFSWLTSSRSCISHTIPIQGKPQLFKVEKFSLKTNFSRHIIYLQERFEYRLQGFQNSSDDNCSLLLHQLLSIEELMPLIDR